MTRPGIDVERMEVAARQRMRDLGAFLRTASDTEKNAVGIALVAMGAAIAADAIRHAARTRKGK